LDADSDYAADNCSILGWAVWSYVLVRHLTMQWTPHYTLQYNAPVEVGFAMLGGRARAMMHQANVPTDIKHLLMLEAVKTATKLDNLISVSVEGVTKSRYKHFVGKNPDWIFHMRTFGKAGVVKTKARKMHPKEADRGVTCFFAGYPDDHPGDCFRMWDPTTGRVHTTRDIIWLHWMYFPKPKNGKEVAPGTLLMPEPVEIIEEPEAREGTGTIKKMFQKYAIMLP
jgi:hypothetical protein